MALCVVCLGGCPDLAAAGPKTLPPPPIPLLPADPAWTVTLPAAPSAGPAMDRDRVYIALASDQIVAFNRETGALLWTRDGRTTSTPVTDGETLYIVEDAAMTAVIASTGAAKWQSPLPAARLPPAIGGTVVTVLTASDELIAVSRSDGAIVWRQAVALDTGPASMAVGADAVYVSGAGGRVIAVSLVDGRLRWTQTLPGRLSPPAIGNKRVFVGSDDNFLYALDDGSGKLAWKFRSGGDVAGAGVGGDVVYYASLDNILRALNRGNGNQRWRTSTTTRPVLPPRVIGDEVLVIGIGAGPTGGTTLSTYDAKTGKVVNSFAAPANLAGGPLVDADLRPFHVAIVIVTRDGRVVALRPQSILFTEPGTAPFTAVPGKPLPREIAPLSR